MLPYAVYEPPSPYILEIRGAWGPRVNKALDGVMSVKVALAEAA